MKKLLFGILVACNLGGCVTPNKWSPEAHHLTMGECRVMCSKAVRSYEPLTGECTCFASRTRR